MTENIDQKPPKFVNVSYLMQEYTISRATVLRWIKADPEIRYFQDGSFLRIHLGDFEKLIEKKIISTRQEQKNREG